MQTTAAYERASVESSNAAAARADSDVAAVSLADTAPPPPPVGSTTAVGVQAMGPSPDAALNEGKV